MIKGIPAFGVLLLAAAVLSGCTEANPTGTVARVEAAPQSSHPELEFFNGLGGFSTNGREYVTVLGEGQWTPAPWINVIANPSFGFQVSESGSGTRGRSIAMRTSSLLGPMTPSATRPARSYTYGTKTVTSCGGPRCSRFARRRGPISRDRAKAIAASSTRHMGFPLVSYSSCH